MLTTPGIPVVAAREIELKSYKQITKLIPFGDMHFGTRGFSVNHWNRFKKRYENDDSCLFLGMGDYTDAMRTHDRKEVMSMAAHEWMMSHYGHEANALYDEMEWMGDRLIGLISGNHRFFCRQENAGFAETVEGDRWLADKLGCQFLGNPGFVFLDFFHKSGGCNKTVTVAAHHGTGGGMLAGSTFNSLEKFSNVVEADIYLMGHDHQIGFMPARGRLKPRRPTPNRPLGYFDETRRFLGRTGSFLKAYEPGQPSYIADKGKAPSALGNIEISIKISRVRTKQKDGTQSTQMVAEIGGGTPPEQ